MLNDVIDEGSVCVCVRWEAICCAFSGRWDRRWSVVSLYYTYRKEGNVTALWDTYIYKCVCLWHTKSCFWFVAAGLPFAFVRWRVHRRFYDWRNKTKRSSKCAQRAGMGYLSKLVIKFSLLFQGKREYWRDGNFYRANQKHFFHLSCTIFLKVSQRNSSLTDN